MELILLNWLYTTWLSYIFGKSFIIFLKKITRIETPHLHISIVVLLGFLCLNTIVDIVAIFTGINSFSQIILEVIAIILWIIAFRKHWIDLGGIKNGLW